MPYWAVARIAARRETFAAERLEASGFEVFAPKTGGRRITPLFPGYLFVSIVDRWRAIDRTPGVLSLVKFGDAPAKCPDAEIDKIRKQIDADGLVRLPSPAKPAKRIGAKVLIAAGPLSGSMAIYAGMSARKREMVLLGMLGRQTKVELRRGQLAFPDEPLAQSAHSELSNARLVANAVESPRPRTFPRRAEPIARLR